MWWRSNPQPEFDPDETWPPLAKASSMGVLSLVHARHGGLLYSPPSCLLCLSAPFFLLSPVSSLLYLCPFHPSMFLVEKHVLVKKKKESSGISGASGGQRGRLVSDQMGAGRHTGQQTTESLPVLFCFVFQLVEIWNVQVWLTTTHLNQEKSGPTVQVRYRHPIGKKISWKE